MLDRCLCYGKDNKSSEKNEECSKVCFNGIRTGDWVKVRINMGMWKKFRGPLKVKEVHRFFVILENGEKWNLRRVAKFGGASSVRMDEDQHSADEHSSKTADGCSSYMLMDDDDLIHRDGDGGGRKGGDCSVGEGENMGERLLRRTQRTHRTPFYMKDYVIYGKDVLYWVLLGWNVECGMRGMCVAFLAVTVTELAGELGAARCCTYGH
ncbi:hypothetical protein NDU88_010240 [Pleurodeles waltl]|uniref:Uncharacterized protein n=1 Tax=Pleurodeles waltl TaxID=8319 RepID=A0AAV7QZQ8_PLEWA|nr:hypothetical protein NDU88_010240 [Pleurodeles waltl]